MLNGWREPDGRIAQLLHVHLGYEVHGTVLGEPASGYLGLARAFLPYGVAWQTESRFGPASGGLCAMWTAFLNVFDDGTAERGMMAFGGPGNRFRFASVLTGDGVAFTTDQVDVTYRASASSFLADIEWRVGADGGTWDFRSAPEDVLDFSSVNPTFGDEPATGYHVSLGTMRRRGDERTPVVSIGWVEGFPEAWTEG
jgi:hypothetical protein